MNGTRIAEIVKLVPQLRPRVWGGTRLGSSDEPIGEAWIAFADSLVAGGPHADRSIAELVAADPDAVLGFDVAARHGEAFPLLVKLLDTADWLSVQVHPSDADAERLLGPGAPGKTEAWYVLDASPGAEGRVGLRRGTSTTELEQAVRDGSVFDLLAPVDFEPGATVLVPAGTLHTIGPGVLLYEIQQASDATFRAWDWGRPATAERPLHPDETLAVAEVAAEPILCRPPSLAGTSATTVARCEHFQLELASLEDVPLTADTERRRFHVITVLDGRCRLTTDDLVVELAARETALVTAATGAYRASAVDEPVRILRASVPG